jgi:hypothetical protein
MSCENKFWVENPPDLVCSYNIIPMKNMDLEEQMNSLTRLAILLFVPTVAITNIRFAAILLVVIIICIIFFYFIKRKNSIKKGDIIEKFGMQELNCKKRENLPIGLSALANAGVVMKPTMNQQIKNQIIYNELSTVSPTNPSCNTGVYCGQTEQNLQQYNKKQDRGISIQYNLNKKREIPPTQNQQSNYFGGNSDRFSSKYNLPTGQGPDFFSYNHALAGNANPRTLIPPVITPKAYDSKYWRGDELINFNQINARSAADTFASGYDVSNCCNAYCTGCNDCSGLREPFDEGETRNNDKQWEKEDDLNRMSNRPMNPFGDINRKMPDRGLGTLTPDMTRGPSWSDLSGQIQNDISSIPNGEMIDSSDIDNALNEYDDKGDDSVRNDREDYKGNYRENFMFPSGSDTRYSNKSRSTFTPPCPGYSPGLNTPNYSIPYKEGIERTGNPTMLGPIKSGSVNVMCGYNPDNVSVYLPTNALAGPCQKDEVMAEYNKNLYTQTIQPGIYSRSEINQPINANIGISFQQQFEPATCRNNGESLEYTLHDPSIPFETMEGYNDCMPIAPGGESKGQVITNYDIYDPRFTGAGSSYRSYIDEMTGQPRYTYDDTNAIRMPNYITRNQLDFSPNFPHYGPMAEKQEGLGAVKKRANDLFLKSALQQRNSLTERYMEKQNTILAQRRSHPINTMSFHRAR